MLDFANLDETTVTVYRTRVAHPAATAAELSELLGLGSAELERADRALTSLRLLSPAPNDGWVAVSPETASDLLLAEAEQELLAQRAAVAGTRATLTALTAEYLDARSRRPGTGGLERVEGEARLRAVLDELGRSCRSSVDAMVPIGGDRPLLPEIPLGLALLERGVVIRTLFQQVGSGHRATVSYARTISTAGAQVKSMSLLPACLLVYDGKTAVLPLEPGPAGADAVVISDQAVLQVLVTLFERHWEQAGDFGAAEPDPVAGPSDLERAVLRLMAAGKKDEVIARQLGISARSISRIVASLMERLQAAGRFQAGVRAASLGWLA
ncbi:helix-turn-helix domain-containing protein [Kitasatospora sp. DSM 101779]|uniref:helix-turn-helix domain-containing protein n=1 Tax=Kitasatospora sp. DSM 101779 TaxID=2853165 RepID=UPI0021DB5A01|nr:helix-turn-helix transcriptional regulator [Kitasatospora sp. DSM 101779]MCU7822165.1 helix-turn-helix transcriptional regulator [Kitasatospora sp. DSM 101779]